MNLRRMNASERSKLYTKFFLIMLVFFLILLILPDFVADYERTHDRDPLTSFPCEDLYNLTINEDLHTKNNKTGNYAPEAILIYYLENCYEAP